MRSSFGALAAPLGGAIADGPVTIAGDCIQEVSGSVLAATASNTIAVQGNQVTSARTYLNGVDATMVESERSDKTFTATASTFTLFTQNSTAGNGLPDHVDTFTRQ